MPERGTSEAMEWIDDFVFDINRMKGLQELYSFKIYRKINNTADDETIYKMEKNRKLYGLNRGIMMTVNEIKSKRARERTEKRYYIEDQVKEKITKVEDFEDQLREEDRWKYLTYEERKLKIQEYPGGPTKIPIEIILQQPTLEEVNLPNGISYAIKDKIYQAYTAILTSEWRREHASQKYVRVWNCTLESLKASLSREIRNEEAFIKQYNDAKAKQEAAQQQLTQQSQTYLPPLPKPQIKRKTIDISHVEDIMGINDKKDRRNPFDDDNLNGDIF